MKDIAWKKVCCPIDYSEASRAAVDVAVDLCRRFGASLTLLHVREGGQASVVAKDWARDAAAAGVQVESAEEAGSPQTVIAEYASRHGFDAIVMGTHGRTGREHALVGSVAESTVRRARCPVMVVHSDWAQLKRARS